MPRVAPSLSFVPDEPFRFVGGHVAADLVNTVNWEARGLERDRLSDFGRVVAWAAAAGVVAERAARRLRAAAAARPADARRAYEAARWLRDVLRRLFGAVAAGTLGGLDGRRALAEFNELLRDATRDLTLAAADRRAANPVEAPLVWRWEPADELTGALHPVAWEAARLLASPDAARVRVCAGVDCGWVYVDQSRNGLRRWCEMQTCGTLEKSRRRAGRSADAAAARAPAARRRGGA